MFDAVPNDSTGYVFAAYTVFLALVLIYIGILGAKFQRINRELTELTEEVEAGRSRAATPAAAGDTDSGGSGV
ncbi:MAG: hypothetical protein M3Y45_04620 [Actinomycetota bacterium]|nr:hypothetical protein [Actinomycetota bacterium]